jgi:hypothetical protein
MDALGNPTGCHLTDGQASDVAGADALLAGLAAPTLIADRGHDAEAQVLAPLRGVAETAEEATTTARTIVQLQGEHRTLIRERGLGVNGLRLLDLLLQRPLVNIKLIEKRQVSST